MANWRARAGEGFELASAAVCLLALLLTSLSLWTAASSRSSAGIRDSVEYWASGQLLAHHQNPYDTAAILRLEDGAGLPAGMPAVVMGNAPPALLLTYPLGFVSAKTGQRVWMLLLIGCLAISVRLMATALGERRWYVQLLGLTFAPALVCIGSGQMAMLVLLGAALFLRFHRTRPLAAGAALWLCLLKPQLFVPFALVLALWMWRNRQARMFAGALGTAVCSAVLVWRLDPRCWMEYHAMMKLERYDKVSIPCLSTVLRDLTGGGGAVQYAAVAAACVWAATYFQAHRREWDWMEHGPLLLLVSLLAAPYTWFVDQCVAIPALMRGLQATRSRAAIAVLALGSAVVELAPLTGRPLLHSNFYLWTMPAWLGWFVAATGPGIRQVSTAAACEREEGALFV